ncbi:MAG TPA: diphthine--ammonia ligase [Chitinophagaceae bacterium]|nr:diphthine--ammonia ligase [Chitinophagaceae bacterium]
MENAFMNWSGGKDSAMALWKVLMEKKYEVKYLLTNINNAKNRISMHGVRRELLEAQSSSIGIPLRTVELPEQPGMAEYETEVCKALQQLKSQGILNSIFGDIFLEDLRKYREDKSKTEGISCVFPLWKINTRTLMNEFLGAGFRAIVVCISEKYLDKQFCGRLIDKSFVEDLPAGVDICGENGEFHSFVFDGPIFKYPISLTKGEIVYREYIAPKEASDNCPNPVKNEQDKYGLYFCDLLPVKA